jgi:membrane-bound inhibitor of C-type lysozyme
MQPIWAMTPIRPVVRLEIGDAVHLLSQVVSGSGARYDNTYDKQGDKRRTWHNKGKGSLFIESAWDDLDGANETIVHCLEP